MKRIPGIWAALIILTLTAAGQAQDWPQWRGPARDGHVPSDQSIPRSLSAARLAWKIPLGNGLASPVVSQGKVVYLDNQNNREVVHAVDAATGKPLWTADLDEAFKDTQSAAGPRCTPLVDDDRVYVQSCRGELKCLRLSDGGVIWRTNYVKDFGATFIGEKGNAAGARRHGNDGSPLIDGDHLIAMAGGPGASAVCFNKKTGQIIWKSQDDIPGYAAPILTRIGGRQQFVAFTVDGVMALDPADGRLLWRSPVKTALGRHVITPVVADDMVVVSSFLAGLIGIRVSSQGPDFKAERAWTSHEEAINFASPVAVGHYLFGVGPNSNLICVDIRTGQRCWEKRGLLAGNGGSAHAGLIVMDKTVLMLTDGGELVLFEADPAAYKELSRTQVCGRNWCNPAYAAGSVFLRDGSSLYRIQLLP